MTRRGCLWCCTICIGNVCWVGWKNSGWECYCGKSNSIQLTLYTCIQSFSYPILLACLLRVETSWVVCWNEIQVKESRLPTSLRIRSSTWSTCLEPIVSKKPSVCRNSSFFSSDSWTFLDRYSNKSGAERRRRRLRTRCSLLLRITWLFSSCNSVYGH